MKSSEDVLEELLKSGKIKLADIERFQSKLASGKTLDKILVKPKDLPDCEGNPKFPCNMPVDDYRFKGMDNRYRCRRCYQVHLTLWEKNLENSNETIPGSVSNTPKPTPEALRARERVRQQFAQRLGLEKR